MVEARTLGNSGLKVRPIGLGGMPLSIAGRPSEAEAVRVILAALEAGMDFVDTADVYCVDHNDIGHNEKLIARALREWGGHRVVVATKGGCRRPDGQWTVNGHPDHLKKACEASLSALGVSTITLYQLHAPDDKVPFADSIGALSELQQAGKIEHVGLSNVSADQIREALDIVPIVSVQNRCNPLERRSWSEGVIELCEEQRIAFLPHSPVGGHFGHVKLRENAALNDVGRRIGASPYQVALAWLLAKSPTMIPIPGASRVESARSSAEAMDLELDEALVSILDAAFPTGRSG